MTATMAKTTPTINDRCDRVFTTGGGDRSSCFAGAAVISVLPSLTVRASQVVRVSHLQLSNGPRAQLRARLRLIRARGTLAARRELAVLRARRLWWRSGSAAGRGRRRRCPSDLAAEFARRSRA